jgi:phosphoglycerate kinase
MGNFKTIDDFDLRGKRVLVRVDLNVPVRDGSIGDSMRIERVAPTILELADRGARVVLLSHFGRPKGKVVPGMTLRPIAEALPAELGGRTVAFAEDCIGPAAKVVVDQLADGDIALLENLRFHAGEEKNDPVFGAALAALGDIYVNDAFSAAHRAHASTTALAELLPAAAGRLMQIELDTLQKALEAPEHPVIALVGGAKVSTKLKLLANLIAKVDVLVIGGGMANTFLHAQGIDIAASLCEKDLADTAREVMAASEAANCKIVLPVDAVISREFRAGAPNEIVDINAVPEGGLILDIGPKSIDLITQQFDQAKTLMWNGPLGAFEIEPFDIATNAAAQAAGRLTQSGKLMSVAGGGDTVAALRHAGAADQFTYVSTAGGAFLEWLEGKALPGVEALKHRQKDA